MMISDLIKNYNAQNMHPSLSFYRDSNKNEIDLIIEMKGKSVPVEIKSTSTILGKFFTIPEWFTNQIKSEEKPIIIYGGNQKQRRTKGIVIPWTDTAELSKSL